MNFRTLALTGASLLMITSAAQADGWYVGLGGGYHSMAATDVTIRTAAASATTEAAFDDTYRIAATAGYVIDQFRLEGEFNYTRPSLKKSDAAAVGFDALNIQEGTFLFNTLYDYPLNEKVALTAGIGIGAAGLDLKYTVAGSKLRTNATAFAWQLIAGMSFKASDRTMVQFDYRFSNIRDINFRLAGSSVLSSPSAPSHNLMISVRRAVN